MRKPKGKWAVMDLGTSGELIGNLDTRGRDAIHIPYSKDSELHITLRKKE